MPNKLEEKDWIHLLRRIKDGKCTPFLGSGAWPEKILVSSQIANEWAKEYGYPMEDSFDLTRVAQFVAVTGKDEMFPRDEICDKMKELLKEITPKYFDIDEPHKVLADLSLPVYINTNYNDLMVRALKSRGITPYQDICRWKESLQDLELKSPDFVLPPPDFVPTPEKPLVYYLHGYYEIPDSLVLTEDDYLDFLAAISNDQNILPLRIQQAFTYTSLLLLGYSIDDWDFRVLFRILSRKSEKIKCRMHISVQLMPGNVSKTQKEKALKYLDSYCEKLNIHVYWDDCRKFAAELEKRWKDYPEPIKKDTDSMTGISRNLEPVKTIPCPTKVDRFNTEYERPGQIKEETNMVSILFLAADPTDASRLRLGEEFREIQEKLKQAKLRNQFTLGPPQLSVRPSDITQALLDTQPQIVHFSGHGTPIGALCFENLVGKSHPIEPDALAALFEEFSEQVNCVVLNACYSEIQAKAIAKHIKYVIGMNQEIGDKAAIAFAIGFYQALGGGCDTEKAYRLGCAQIQLQNIPGQQQNIPCHLKPVLIKKVQS